MASVVEFNKQSDSSTRPRAPMDLVPLNEPLSEKHSEVKVTCSHFSIRGYVSEVRKRDPRRCYPFTMKDSVKPLYTELPPMEVPKFRWWRCIGCVPESDVSSVGVGNNHVHQPEKNPDKSMALVGNTSKVNVSKERNGEASTSIDSNYNRDCRENVVFDPKGKGKAHVDVELSIPSAYDNDFLKNSTQGFMQQTTGRIEVTLNTCNPVELGSKFPENGTIKALQKDSREYLVKTGLTREYPNHNGEHSNEICQKKSQDFMQDELVKLVNEARNDGKSRLLNLPDLNECSREPLYDETNEAVNTNNNNSNNNKNNDSNNGNNDNNDINCEDDDDYLGAECRKNPKVRLLSELLGLKETQICIKGRKKNPSLTNSLDESLKRKRGGSQEEGSKSMETRVVTRTTESSEFDSEYTTDSDDISTEIISKNLEKRRCRSRIPLLERRNNNKSKIDHRGPSIHREKIMLKSTAHERGKNSENLPPKSDVTDKLIERSLVMTKKRGKLCHSKEGNCSFKNRVSKEFESIEKDEDAEKIYGQKVQKTSENDHRFAKNLGNFQDCVSRGEDGPGIPSSKEGLMIIDGNGEINQHENRNNGGEASVVFKTSTTVGDSFNRNGERNIYLGSNMKDKKDGTRDEVGSLVAEDTRVQASNSVAKQKEQIKEVRGRIHDIDINSIPIDDKVTDDIPMDIVELMAKNQYERHLSDPKDTPFYPATPEISGKVNGKVNDLYGGYCPKPRQSPFLNIPRPPTITDPRNSGYFSDFNYNSLGVSSCYPRENTVSSRFLSPNQEENRGLTFGCRPPCGLTFNSWNGNINMGMTQRYPPSFPQGVESYRVRTCSPRNEITEPSSVWPSVIASHVPLGLSNRQMVPQSSNFQTKGKFVHHQNSGSILNFNTAGPTGLRKQQNLNFSNSDVNSNDAVSAMHLLSLMQNAAALSLGPTQTAMGPTSSRQPFIKEKGIQETSRHPCYPTPIPKSHPFATSYQNQSDVGTMRRNCNNGGFVGPIPLTLRGQRNIQNPHFGLPGGDNLPRSQHNIGLSLEKGKGRCVISQRLHVNPMQGTMTDSSQNLFARGVKRDERTIMPTPEKMICKLNQNPSEFNDLKELSRYMIGPNELRPRRMARKKTARSKGDPKSQDIRLNKA